MGFLQKIKEFFGIKNIKMIDAPKEQIEESSDKIKLIEYRENVNKSQDIIDVLRIIGCKKDVISAVSRFTEFEKENLKKVINTLKGLDYSKLQISVILSSNIDILRIDNNILADVIKKLNEYLKNKESISNIIYSNPFILTQNLSGKIEDIKNTFVKLGLDFESQRYILEENPNIFLLKHDRFMESLIAIMECTENNDEFLQEILSDPLIIGIVDKEVLTTHF